MMRPLVVAFVAVMITMALKPLTKGATTTYTRTLQTRVNDKRRESSIICVGFFTPTVKHILLDERRLQAEASNGTYEASEEGDAATIAQYSNGAYSVDQ